MIDNVLFKFKIYISYSVSCLYFKWIAMGHFMFNFNQMYQACKLNVCVAAC